METGKVAALVLGIVGMGMGLCYFWIKPSSQPRRQSEYRQDDSGPAAGAPVESRTNQPASKVIVDSRSLMIDRDNAANMPKTDADTVTQSSLGIHEPRKDPFFEPWKKIDHKDVLRRLKAREKVYPSEFSDLMRGKSRAEVKKMLGKPKKANFVAGVEHWYYHHIDLNDDSLGTLHPLLQFDEKGVYATQAHMFLP